ncbi:MAG: glutamate--tRNA ligase [Robiginitomaculum sp.]|nr:glutamate--tRNA ligase [Robiginitomaculum sp.]
MTKIVTRFAPSPTGYLHIGGARTALFNWLFARHHGGKYLVRIEDTDSARSTPEAIEAIISGLDWLGLAGDEPPIFQSNASARHVEIADELLRNGQAYPCYLTREQLEHEKQQARLQKRNFQSPWRDTKPNQCPTNLPYVVRLKTPMTGQTVIADQVQGNVTFENSVMDDLVLLRADRTPTYMLAVVVDDHDAGVTHVIRGDDHLVNAARQTLIYAGMGWALPVYAHIPLIHGPDGKKLSKRHGALGIHAYRDMGYLSQALLNYLLRLGWSHGDQEFFSMEQAINAFCLTKINKGPARLDFDKMGHVNNHYLRIADPSQLAKLLFQFMEEKTGTGLSDFEKTKIQTALPHVTARANLLSDLIGEIAFLLAKRPIELTQKASKSVREETVRFLELLVIDLRGIKTWNTEQIHASLQAFAVTNNIGFGKFGPILRAAISGGASAPDLAVACMLLGREETLGRVDDLLTSQVSSGERIKT